jgi:hypothetical protein
LGANWAVARKTALRVQATRLFDRDINLGRVVGTGKLEEHFKGYTLADASLGWDSQYGRFGWRWKACSTASTSAIIRNRRRRLTPATATRAAAAPWRGTGAACSASPVVKPAFAVCSGPAPSRYALRAANAALCEGAYIPGTHCPRILVANAMQYYHGQARTHNDKGVRQ